VRWIHVGYLTQSTTTRPHRLDSAQNIFQVVLLRWCCPAALVVEGSGSSTASQIYPTPRRCRGKKDQESTSAFSGTPPTEIGSEWSKTVLEFCLCLSVYLFELTLRGRCLCVLL
jgi:hypothetical protein